MPPLANDPDLKQDSFPAHGDLTFIDLSTFITKWDRCAQSHRLPKEFIMGDTGKRDKSKRESQKKQGQSIKEKRRLKKEKRNGAASEMSQKS